MTEARKRLGFVVVTSSMGGMETYLLRLLRKIGHAYDIHVYVRTPEKGALHDAFVQTGVRLVYHPLGYFNLRRQLGFFQMIRRDKLDALVDLTGAFAGVSMALSALAGIPGRITFYRRSTYAFDYSGLRKLYMKLSLWCIRRFATRILSNSRAALVTYHGLAYAQAHADDIIPNFLDPQELKPSVDRASMRSVLGLTAGDFVVIHVGRLDPAKNHEAVIKSLAAAVHRQQRIQVLIVGPKTPSLAQTYREVLKSSVVSHFHFLGARTDVTNLLHASDAFLFPSWTEGQPNALLEACLADLPVIASNIAPIAEVIPARGKHLLVEPSDHQALTEAVLRCAESEAACAQRRYREDIMALTDPDRIIDDLMDRIWVRPTRLLSRAD